ncbi:hypothetical protein B0I37DRAFT_446953 [Chaetomium sp. MPI-CAGE-AT-0009]|nr:hypothetical protein B0I37DRAFT_446953 [Chaetomium sp. MPI-CAGE-AT-0009]
MVSCSGALTAAGWLLAGVAATVAHERFVAVETGAILSPRQYPLSPAHALGKRQAGCNPGYHSCDDIGPPGKGYCCPNHQYCIVDPNNTTTAGCCHIGLTCNSPCSQTAFQCDHTTTQTTSGSPTTRTIPGGACCARTCTGTSQFQCPTSLGGGCCQYGQRCAPAADGGGGGGTVWWWCVRRRRQRRAAEVGEVVEGVDEGGSSVRPRPTGVVGRVVGGSATGGGREREMSDATSDWMSRSGRGGLAQDYFGPDPAVGPYSETHNTSPVTTPGLDRGGVPLQPHEPGDIAVPVEIDSRMREEGRTPVGLAITPGANRSHDSDDGQERYELYGSEIGQISPTLASPYAGGMFSPDERPR